MRYVKTLGLAAVAIAVLMAFVGAGTVSATVLCKTAPNAEGNCAAGWAYTGEIHAVSTEKPQITSTFKTIECNEMAISGTPENEGSATETVRVPVSSWTFSGSCNCTVVVAQKGALEIHWISGTQNGTVTTNGATVTVNCSTIFGTVHCNYVTEHDDLGPITGGVPPTMHVTIEIKRESTSALCDEESTGHFQMRVTFPDGTYVARGTQ